MPNYCFYEMRAKGAPLDLAELRCDMLAKSADGGARPRHMARIFTADITDKKQNADGSETWTIEGECAWSAYCCMTHAGKGTYGLNPETGRAKEWFIGIEDEAKERNCAIEVHDSEVGYEFATRMTVGPNRALTCEEFDYQEIGYDPAFDDIDELRDAHGLTDEEISALKSGEYITRTDFDGAWTYVN